MFLQRINIPGMVFLAFVICVWEIGAQSAGSIAFPTASAVGNVLINDWQNLFEASVVTLKRAGIGFAIALVVMLPIGIILGRVRVLGELIEPVLDFMRPLPPIAVVPLVMMLLGIGDSAKLTVVVYGASFPILINALEAVKVQDPMQTRLGRSLGLSTLERMVLIDLPAAMPRIFAGIRLSITVSVLLTIVAELMLSTDGLGDYLQVAQSDFDMAAVVAALVVVAIVALSVNALTNFFSRRMLDWHFRRAGIAHE